MTTDVVLTCDKLFQLECHCQLVLVNLFGLQLIKTFLLLLTKFYNQDVVENVVTKGWFSTSDGK